MKWGSRRRRTAVGFLPINKEKPLESIPVGDRFFRPPLQGFDIPGTSAFHSLSGEKLMSEFEQFGLDTRGRCDLPIAHVSGGRGFRRAWPEPSTPAQRRKGLGRDCFLGNGGTSSVPMWEREEREE